MKHATAVPPGAFEPAAHYYPKALNATIHPMVNFFLALAPERVVTRYCHLNPLVDRDALTDLLTTPRKYFQWAGADLINVTTAEGRRQMVVIENNSCPSGQKSMPLRDDHEDQGGYRQLVARTIAPLMRARKSLPGRAAVVYDKNPMEATGYAAALADALDEEVLLAECHLGDPDNPMRFTDGVMELRDDTGAYVPVRAAFRYLTQAPWRQLPLRTRTRILNPVVACLAGGRNKMIAAKAYDLYNGQMTASGLQIRTPVTLRDVTKTEIPLFVQQFGGQAVIKVPYSNAGQGVFTIVTPLELEAFMARDYPYDRFIVQSLIGNYRWSSQTTEGRFYHVGTLPTSRGHTYVADLRVMLSSSGDGLRPICVYGRRAREPLADHLTDATDSWAMLGTNLSYRREDGTFDTDSSRLMLTDRRDFNKLGVGIDDLIEAYVQTAMSTAAIDELCQRLHNKQGRFRRRLFASLNDDPSLLSEIRFDA